MNNLETKTHAAKALSDFVNSCKEEHFVSEEDFKQRWCLPNEEQAKSRSDRDLGGAPVLLIPLTKGKLDKWIEQTRRAKLQATSEVGAALFVLLMFAAVMFYIGYRWNG